jgi:ketosteroid isomerase-like protein
MYTRLLFLVLLMAGGFAQADDADDAAAKVHEYFATFNARDIDRVATAIYSTPVHVGGGEGHSVLATPEAARDNLRRLYDMLDTQGWERSVIENVKTCVASDSLALVDTRYSRIDHDGNPIPPTIRTNLYVLQKLDGDWRIVAFYGHDAERRPAC